MSTPTPSNSSAPPPHSLSLVPALVNINQQENFIIIASVLAIVYGLINAYLILKINVSR